MRTGGVREKREGRSEDGWSEGEGEGGSEDGWSEGEEGG